MKSAPMTHPAGRAWLVWGLGPAFYAYGFFQRVAPAVMVDDLMRDFALGAALLGSLSAAYSTPMPRSRSRSASCSTGPGHGRCCSARPCSPPPAVLCSRPRAPAMLGAGLTSVASLLALSLWPPAPLGLLFALFVTTGLAGGFMIVAFAITRDAYAGRAAATAMGVINTAVLLIGPGLQSLIGWLLDRQWTGLEQAGARLYTEPAYRHAFLVLAASSALALLSAFLLQRRS